MSNKVCHIYGGGTVSHVASHLALAAPAYGKTARYLAREAAQILHKMDIELHLTKMAGGNLLETNDHIATHVANVVDDPATRVIIFTCAMTDFSGHIRSSTDFRGKYANRLDSSVPYMMELTPAEKIIRRIRQTRKDIFLVGFKTTCGLLADEQYIKGLNLCKKASCNLVLANDVVTRLNMVITPEEARYHQSTDRNEVLTSLLEMVYDRTHLNFTRSTVVDGHPVSWNSPEVPQTLREVVNWCISQNAYKPFNGSTAGHFAVKLSPTEFLTSIRKTNFNNLSQTGLVRVKTDGPDNVIAYGAKPSVGGQSQRIVFNDHSEANAILHFHCPIKDGSLVPRVSQREFECGSHECGKNTSNGLKQFGNLKAVYLENHGPNIVFNSSIDPNEVIKFIQDNFDLSKKTGGYVTLNERLNTKNVLETATEVL